MADHDDHTDTVTEYLHSNLFGIVVGVSGVTIGACLYALGKKRSNCTRSNNIKILASKAIEEVEHAITQELGRTQSEFYRVSSREYDNEDTRQNPEIVVQFQKPIGSTVSNCWKRNDPESDPFFECNISYEHNINQSGGAWDRLYIASERYDEELDAVSMVRDNYALEDFQMTEFKRMTVSGTKNAALKELEGSDKYILVMHVHTGSVLTQVMLDFPLDAALNRSENEQRYQRAKESMLTIVNSLQITSD